MNVWPHLLATIRVGWDQRTRVTRPPRATTPWSIGL
jgi:hypothetical protein